MVKLTVSLLSRFIPRHHLQRFAALGLRLISPLYYGKRFEDPITGKTYRKMLPYGRIHSRANALAPHSLSLERHRLMWLYLKERTTFFSSNLRVLHIAPEYCFLRPFGRMTNIDYVTADLISPWAQVKLDVQQMLFDDNSFDVILCNHVLEHVPNDIKAMRELLRVMKPGGFGIFQVPLDASIESTVEDLLINTPELREKHYGQRDHVRLYGTDYAQRLRSVGFEVTEDDFVKQLDPSLVARYCLPKDEIVYLCSKPILQ
jgi:SAM-dependent methyltransferase